MQSLIKLRLLPDAQGTQHHVIDLSTYTFHIFQRPSRSFTNLRLLPDASNTWYSTLSFWPQFFILTPFNSLWPLWGFAWTFTVPPTVLVELVDPGLGKLGRLGHWIDEAPDLRHQNQSACFFWNSSVPGSCRTDVRFAWCRCQFTVC